jgi:hypothetical protein
LRSKIIVGAMLLRGRLPAATSLVAGALVKGLVEGVKLKSVSSLLSRKPKLLKQRTSAQPGG